MCIFYLHSVNPLLDLFLVLLFLSHAHTHVHTHTHTCTQREYRMPRGDPLLLRCVSVLAVESLPSGHFLTFQRVCSLVDASRMLWHSHLFGNGLDFFGVGVNSSSVRCRGGPRCGGGSKQNQRRCLNGSFVQLVKHWRKNRAKQEVNSIRFV